MSDNVKLFSDILDTTQLPRGWERALYACMNDGGFKPARQLAALMRFGLGLEWVWGPAAEDEEGGNGLD